MPSFLRLAGQVLMQIGVLVQLGSLLLRFGNQALSRQFAQIVLLLLLRILLLWTAVVGGGGGEGHDLLGSALLGG